MLEAEAQQLAALYGNGDLSILPQLVVALPSGVGGRGKTLSGTPPPTRQFKPPLCRVCMEQQFDVEVSSWFVAPFPLAIARGCGCVGVGVWSL